MNWQAEFLDNPEIRLTFDHFPFFQKQGIMENRFSFDYQHYDSPEGMPAGDRELVEEARRAVARAYAPYSKFRVGAAARLRSGKILCGSNQESEVFPAGMCAERSMPERAMPTIRSRRWPSLRSRPSGSAIPADSAARCCSMRSVARGRRSVSSCPVRAVPRWWIRPCGCFLSRSSYNPLRNYAPFPMFAPEDILYEDNHLLIVNKRCGDLVQPDPSGGDALERQIKEFIRRRDAKPGEVFLGVVHRIDRPVSGAVIFAKTSKALARLNEMIRRGEIKKTYWALTESRPDPEEGELCHYILRNEKTNRSRALDAPRGDAKLAKLRYRTLGASARYTLVEVDLLTGRHHQIRAQLSKIGCPIKGDLKYGARRSNPDGGISLHSYRVDFIHPVRRERIVVTAPVPKEDNLWAFFARQFSLLPCEF